MPAISAADALGPAIQRTRTLLFRPFRPGTYLKLCVVALLTEGLGGNFSFPGHSHSQTIHRTSHISTEFAGLPFAFTPERIAAGVAMGLLVLLVGMAIFYLITRLRFAYFHCLIHNTREIRPGWRLYREQAGRFFRMNVAVGIGFLVVAALAVLPFAAGFLGLFRSVGEGARPDLGAILALVLPLIPIVILLVLAGIAVDLVLRDWMLPHYALEDMSAGEAWSEVWARVRLEKWAFFGYALLRVVLPIVAVIAIAIVLIVPALVFVAMVGGMEVLIHAGFADATGAAAGVGILLEVLVGVVSFAVAVLVGIAVGGPVSTGVREYALVFYGGRYRRLGEILYPAAPPVAGAGFAGDGQGAAT